MDFYVRDKVETAIHLNLNIVLLICSEAIPFIDGDYQGTTRIKRITNHMQILVDDTFLGINHNNRDVRIVNCLQGFDD